MAVGKGNMLVVELLLGTYHDNVESRTDSVCKRHYSALHLYIQLTLLPAKYSFVDSM